MADEDDLLFHERERLRLKGEVPDVLIYDFPSALRKQIVMIWRKVLPQWSEVGDSYEPPPWQNQMWKEIDANLLMAFGTFALAEADGPQRQIETFFLNCPVAEAWSVVESVFRAIGENGSLESECDDAIVELNKRVRQHSVGFEFDGYNVIRIDSQYVHAETVRPALVLLNREGFAGAEAEFIRGHEHYRNGRYKEAMVDALKAFESTMKCIAKLRSIQVDPKATAKPLIDVMVSAKVLPESLTAHFGGLRAALESGLPTQRNTKAGHGDGPEVKEVPRHVAAHCLHLAAANIVFLVESHLAAK